MPEREQRNLRLWEPMLVAMAASIGLLAGYNMNFDNSSDSLLKVESNSVTKSAVQGDGRIEEIIRFIETKYVDSIETDQMALNLIDDMLSKLDPHSSYITAEELSSHNEKMNGKYRGIGIEALNLRDTFYISHLAEEGPAKSGGLEIGDAFLRIEGKGVTGQEIGFDVISELLRDSSKTELTIDVLKLSGEEESLQVGIDDIVVPSASLCYLLNEETAYLKLARFSANTYEQFIESIDKIKEGRTSLNLILDLRDNPGGYLPQAIKILSQLFDKKDQLLTYTKGLNQKKKEFRTTGNAFYNIGKVAVLIDGNSASGSEILSGAIQDWDRGVVIGQTSYGKGLVQEIYPLNNGGALRLTVAKYYTPSGRLIQRSYKSVNNKFQADSNVFLTKVLSREMPSGIGIVPDQLLPKVDHRACYDYHYYIDYFLLDQFKAHHNSELPDELISESAYHSFILENFGEQFQTLVKGCNQNLTDAIWDRYNQMVLPQVALAKVQNKNDLFINEALEFMSDKRPTLALLSEKE